MSLAFRRYFPKSRFSFSMARIAGEFVLAGSVMMYCMFYIGVPQYIKKMKDLKEELVVHSRLPGYSRQLPVPQLPEGQI